MAKPIIAVDIDDVLSASAESFAAFSNSRYGSNVTADDYEEDWAAVWNVAMPEARRRAKEYHASGIQLRYEVKDGAEQVLRTLRKRYSLVVVTSRLTVIQEATQTWLDKFFPGIFDDVHYSGAYEGSRIHKHMLNRTKAGLLKEIGVAFLIDDMLKHCKAAADADIESVLFGNYTWNSSEALPPRVTRCKDWSAVLEYFDGR